MKTTLGGKRIGAGKGMEVKIHDWSRSSHNLSRAWRSSMQPGVLYPCFIELALDKDTFDIDVDALVRTIPTIGPLYGSYKMQVEFGFYPDRLAVGALHGNAVGVGLNMEKVEYPKMRIPCARWESLNNENGYYVKHNTQMKHMSVNTSSLMHFLGICSLPVKSELETTNLYEDMNAIPLIAYWEWFKNYHANKQEKNAYVIKGSFKEQIFVGIEVNGRPQLLAGEREEPERYFNYDQKIAVGGGGMKIAGGMIATKQYIRDTEILSSGAYNNMQIQLIPNNGSPTWWPLKQIFDIQTYGAENTAEGNLFTPTDTEYSDYGIPSGKIGNEKIYEYKLSVKPRTSLPPEVQTAFINSNGMLRMQAIKTTSPTDFIRAESIDLEAFPLENIDKCREDILSIPKVGQNLLITASKNTSTEFSKSISYEPYLTAVQEVEEKSADGETTLDTIPQNAFPLNGLAVKCYMSDIFNNWLRTEWLDGDNGINAITAVDTSSGSFTLDTLILQKKIYQVLNRVAISDGSYKGWKEANWGYSSFETVESPIFIGGAIWDVEFDEVVSTAASGNEPLGTLGGRGNSYQKHNGHIKYKCQESGFIMGFISLTPKVDYSEGIKWWYNQVETPNDLHKAGLDGIGFQELPLRQMAGWVTNPNLSAGKQLSWQHYMTTVNENHGDFADENKAMFMTLNRRYTPKITPDNTGRRNVTIGDLTTYIDPTKYNYAFADTSITAQNFWVQLGMKVSARRVMSANQIPNL